jgi:transketolase
MTFDPANPDAPDRDRLLIGKGHACLAFYSIFLDLGVITQELFDTYGQNGGLGGQLDVSVPGVEYNTGSLGHVLGIAAGIALASQLDDQSYRAVAIMGDAECCEGSVWEAVIFAGQQKLSRLVAIVDRNRLSVTDVLDDDGFFRDFTAKLRGFDWEAYEIDGHSFEEILAVLEKARKTDKPVMIVANTIKGKGISFMENGIKWHHGVPNPAELEIARRELTSVLQD